MGKLLEVLISITETIDSRLKRMRKQPSKIWLVNPTKEDIDAVKRIMKSYGYEF